VSISVALTGLSFDRGTLIIERWPVSTAGDWDEG
jgi:hypothetical protein